MGIAVEAASHTHCAAVQTSRQSTELDLASARHRRIYRRNIELLRKLKPRVAEAVEQADMSQVKVLRTPTGQLTMRLGERWLLSRYNPVRQVEGRCQALEQEPDLLIILHGLGLADHALRLLRRSTLVMVIHEPEPAALKAAMHVRDLRRLFIRATLVLDLEDPALFTGLWARMKQRISFWPLEGYMGLGLKQLEELVARVELIRKLLFAQKEAYEAKAPLHLSNCLANLPAALELPMAHEMTDALEGKPALIVAAGPSLDNDMEMIRRAKGRMVIIAVGTILKRLLSEGIEPDVCVAIESNDILYQFDGADLSRIVLVLCVRGAPELFRLRAGRKITLVDKDLPSRWVARLLERDGCLDPGGSVATAAFTCALHWGCDPIVMVGQDLSLSAQGSGHARGAGLGREDLREEEQRTLSDPARMAESGLLWVPGLDGKPVLTRQQLDFFRRWYEQTLDGLKTPTLVINSTSRGAAIRGAPSMPLPEAIDAFGSADLDLTTALAPCFDRPPDFDEGAVAARLKGAAEYARHLHRVATRAAELAENMFRMARGGRRKEVRKTQRQLPELMKLDLAINATADVLKAPLAALLRSSVEHERELEVRAKDEKRPDSILFLLRLLQHRSASRANAAAMLHEALSSSLGMFEQRG